MSAPTPTYPNQLRLARQAREELGQDALSLLAAAMMAARLKPAQIAERECVLAALTLMQAGIPF